MRSEGRLKALLPALLATLLVVLLAPTASAQGLPEGEPVYTTQKGQGYEVYADGSLNIGGDVLGSCDTVLQSVQQGPLEPTRETYMQIEVCEEAGFSVPGSETLPETGGRPSWPLWRRCSWAGPSSPSAFAGSGPFRRAGISAQPGVGAGLGCAGWALGGRASGGTGKLPAGFQKRKTICYAAGVAESGGLYVRDERIAFRFGLPGFSPHRGIPVFDTTEVEL